MTQTPRHTGATSSAPARLMRAAAAALGLAVVLPAMPATAGDGVLVELFTSQGCSSCPPADHVLGELAERDGIVALSFHVDYWDYLGWRDTFARTEFSKRQFAYRDAWGERVVYTPQMVVGGDTGIVGSRRSEVRAALKDEAAESSAAPGRIEIVAQDGAVSATLSGLPLDGVVWSAKYLQSASVAIERGENRGREITYHNIVRDLMRLGSVAQVGARIAIPQPAPGEGVAVWVQAPDLGTVHAVAQHEVPLSTAAIR